MIPEISVQGGILTLLGTIVVGLLGWRGFNKVGHDNARGNRESRFEENLQARFEAELAKNSELRAELESVRAKLAEADKRLTVIQMMSDGDPARAVQISQDSAFVDLSRPLRPRSQTPRPSGNDPFQAADPFAPPPAKPKPKK